MKLITISGLDGSGKSTQIKLLKDELERTGSKVFYFHTVQFSLANKFKRGLDSRLRGNDSDAKSVTSATPFQIWLRKIFLRIDIWRFSLLRSMLRNKGYDYILSDRYFYDSVVNIEFLENRRRDALQCVSTKAIYMPNLAIYLQTLPETIMSRERVPDQGLEYLQKKKELYDAHATDWNMCIIDGNRDKNVIFEEIKNHVHSR